MNQYLRFAPLLLLAGGVMMSPGLSCQGPGPGPPDGSADLVDDYFDSSEVAFRQLQGQKADKLRAGEFETEADSVKWFETEFTAAKRIAVKPLLDYEFKQFGREKWTPEGEAAIAERWSKGGAR